MSQEASKSVAENLLGLKGNLVSRVAQGAGLDSREMGADFDLRLLSGLKSYDGKTIGVLNKMNLVSGGMVNIPLLLVVPKYGRIAQEGKENLRYRFNQFDGDMELIPSISVGFEAEDNKFMELEEFHLFTGTESVGLRWESSHDTQGKHRKQAQLFKLKLTDEESFLFNHQGLLKSDNAIVKMAEGISRIVNLEYLSLTDDEFDRFRGFLIKFDRQDKVDLITLLQRQFNLKYGQVASAKLEDFNVRILWGIIDSKTDEVIFKIENIALPRFSNQDKLFRLKNIVRPKLDGEKGDLVIQIWSSGEVSNWIERDNLEARDVVPEGFDQPTTLATLLAKLK